MAIWGRRVRSPATRGRLEADPGLTPWRPARVPQQGAAARRGAARRVIGTAELTGAAGLLIPPLAGLAAAGLAADMAGATIINIAVLHSAAATATIALCAALVLLAWTSREQTRHLAAALRR